MLHDIDLCEIFECTHLKFTVSGRSTNSVRVQCSHAIVWGSLRLEPISSYSVLPSCLRSEIKILSHAELVNIFLELDSTRLSTVMLHVGTNTQQSMKFLLHSVHQVPCLTPLYQFDL